MYTSTYTRMHIHAYKHVFTDEHKKTSTYVSATHTHMRAHTQTLTHSFTDNTQSKIQTKFSSFHVWDHTVSAPKGKLKFATVSTPVGSGPDHSRAVSVLACVHIILGRI